MANAGANGAPFLIALLIFSAVAPFVRSSYSCSPGKDCIASSFCSQEDIPCPLGTFCPFGNSSSRRLLPHIRWCGAGELCETPATAIECPSGSYCNVGTFKKQECGALALCPPGRKIPIEALWVMISAPIAIILIVSGLFLRSKSLKRNVTRVSSTTALDAGRDINLNIQVQTDRLALHVRFEDIGVAVGQGEERKVVLKGLSGEFTPGSVTAIMGPSGAGKTTLMSVVLGKVRETSGRIYVNGQEDRLSNFSTIIGLVPQEDIMIRSLTVYDTLRHSAYTRLPQSWTNIQRNDLIDRTIDLLDLQNVRALVIGMDGGNGLNAGMRKRVNIAIELCASPGVLFLDEPTTGLDSSSSQDIMTLLRRIASTGLTIITVLHQPRFEIFKLCTNVLLLGSGGWQAYSGTTEGVLSYFKSMGYTCPDDTNPPDFFLDVLALRYPQDDGTPSSYEHMQNFWKVFCRADCCRTPSNIKSITHSLKATLDISSADTDDENDKNLRMVSFNSQGAKNSNNTVTNSKGGYQQPQTPISPAMSGLGTSVNTPKHFSRRKDSHFEKALQILGVGSSKAVRVTPNFSTQLYLYLRRSVLEIIRDSTIFTMQMILHIVSGVCLGVGLTFLYTPPLPIDFQYMCPSIIADLCKTRSVQGIVVSYFPFFFTMIVGAVASVAAVPTFGNNRPVYWREASSGTSALAFFTAKCLLDIVMIVLYSFMFLSFFMLVTTVPGGFLKWFTITFTLEWAAYGIGYFVSSVIPLNRALIVAAVVGVALAVTSGQSPTVPQVRDYYGPLRIIWDCSYNRWSGEAMAIIVVDDARKAGYRVDMALEQLGFVPSNLPLCFGIPVLLGLSWRLMAYLGMRFTNRDKQT